MSFSAKERLLGKKKSSPKSTAPAKKAPKKPEASKPETPSDGPGDDSEKKD